MQTRKRRADGQTGRGVHLRQRPGPVLIGALSGQHGVQERDEGIPEQDRDQEP